MVFPRGVKHTRDLPCYAATHDLNGMGELTGTHAIGEWGFVNTVPDTSVFLSANQLICIPANCPHQHR